MFAFILGRWPPGGMSLDTLGLGMYRKESEKRDEVFRCQVVPAGPPAGAGESGSADQREQEEWSFGENQSNQ